MEPESVSAREFGSFIESEGAMLQDLEPSEFQDGDSESNPEPEPDEDKLHDNKPDLSDPDPAGPEIESGFGLQDLVALLLRKGLITVEEVRSLNAAGSSGSNGKGASDSGAEFAFDAHTLTQEIGRVQTRLHQRKKPPRMRWLRKLMARSRVLRWLGTRIFGWRWRRTSSDEKLRDSGDAPA